MVDWALFDPEGAMRQRFLELDDRSEDVKETLAAGPGGLPAFQDSYDICWIYHENGLEGVVLTYPEIKSAVDKRVVSDVSLLPTYEVVKAQKACIDLIREKALNKRFVVTIPFLQELHGMLLDEDEQDEKGEYRKDIPIHRTYFHEIAHPAKIQQSLQKVLDTLKAGTADDTHPIELAANVHHRFMRVFPFSEHSGMIGRLLFNFVLMRYGYLPAIIHSADRQRYYEALRNPERDFRQFVAETMENSLENAERFVQQAKPAARTRRA